MQCSYLAIRYFLRRKGEVVRARLYCNGEALVLGRLQCKRGRERGVRAVVRDRDCDEGRHRQRAVGTSGQ